MNISNAQLGALVEHWLGKISATLFSILAFLYWEAVSSPDGKVGKSVEDIALAIGLAHRTVRRGLHELAMLGATEILSVARERTLIQIPRPYWLPPLKSTTPDAAPATIPELVHRLCGQRASPEMLVLMKTDAGDDEPRLQRCLDSFLQQGKRWEIPDLLVVAVLDDQRPRGYFDEHWGRP